MKKQLFLAVLMSVTAFSAQASDLSQILGQATIIYGKEVGQATAVYATELGQAGTILVEKSAELAKTAFIRAIIHSLPYAVKEPIFSQGFSEGFSDGFRAGQHYAYTGIVNDLKYMSKCAVIGIATYYAVKSVKAYIQDANKPAIKSLSEELSLKKNQ